jgi:arylsulfatase A-like enzyme
LGGIRASAETPNIVYILCDDLGYGDLSCLNPQGKIATPNIDRLSREGMRCSDMHSGSSVCTSTRYGILTGRYAWRTRLGNGVLGGLSPPLIDRDRLTVGGLLQRHGYHTACVGKWHLGLQWQVLPGKTVADSSIETPDQVHNVDYAAGFREGPTTRGFHHYFGISASLEMDQVTALPTLQRDFPMVLGTGKGRTRRGPAAPDFETTDVLPALTKEAVRYLQTRANDRDRPFFLYLPLTAPHTPIAPSANWRGKSGLSPYADFVLETDAAIGEILGALDELGFTKSTIVIVTSDNGFSPAADLKAHTSRGHFPSCSYRGTKADIFEGGHRIPFLVRWPERIAPATTSAATMCLTDFLATVAEILGEKVPENAGEDSFSMLPVWSNAMPNTRRDTIVHHSINGSFAIRSGPWKLIFAADSGGWSFPRPGTAEAANLPALQLYNLEEDSAEQLNVTDRHPEIVDRLTREMKSIVDRGRSTPGASQANDRKVDFRHDKRS